MCRIKETSTEKIQPLCWAACREAICLQQHFGFGPLPSLGGGSCPVPEWVRSAVSVHLRRLLVAPQQSTGAET